MKGKFDVNDHLMKNKIRLPINYIEEMVEQKAGFAVIAMSSTGLNNDETIPIHMPIRATIQEFKYDENSKTYVENGCFDRFIKCSKEALKAALDNKENYDVFKEGGIDEEAYIRGDNVISPEEFKQELKDYFKSIDPDIQFFISNSSEYIKSMMNRINIPFQGFNDDGKMIISTSVAPGKNLLYYSQPTLTKQFYSIYAPDVPRGNNLDVLMKMLAQNSSKQTVLDNLEANYKGTELRVRKIQLFVNTIGEAKGVVLFNHADKDDKNTDKDKNEVVENENSESPVSEINEPSGEINPESIEPEHQEEYGKPIGEDEEEPFEMKEPEEDKETEPEKNNEDKGIDDMENIKDGDISEEETKSDDTVLYGQSKLKDGLPLPDSEEETIDAPIYKMIIDQFIETEEINPESILNRESDCAINSVYKMVEQQDGKKGFSVLQVLSTSEDTGNIPYALALLAVEHDDKSFLKPIANVKGFFELPEKVIAFEDEEFNTFEMNGISADFIRDKNNLISDKTLNGRLEEYFKRFPLNEYPLISDKHIDGEDISRSQRLLSSKGNHKAFNCPSIDIEQVFKEYLYLTLHNKDYKQNVLLSNPGIFASDEVDLHSIAENNNYTRKGALNEALYVAYLITQMGKQQKELYPADFEKKEMPKPERSEDFDERRDRDMPKRRRPLSRHIDGDSDRPSNRWSNAEERYQDMDRRRNREPADWDAMRRKREDVPDRYPERSERADNPEWNPDTPSVSPVQNGRSITEILMAQQASERQREVREEPRVEHSEPIAIKAEPEQHEPQSYEEAISIPEETKIDAPAEPVISKDEDKPEIFDDIPAETPDITDDEPPLPDSSEDLSEPNNFDDLFNATNVEPTIEEPEPAIAESPEMTIESPVVDKSFQEKAVEAMVGLVKTVSDMTHILKAQVELHNDMTSKIMAHQMAMIETIYQNQKESKNMNLEADGNNTIDYLQKIKEEIAIVSNSIDNSQLQNALDAADKSLEQGQKILCDLISEKNLE